jgi:phosphohistidine phosphatase
VSLELILVRHAIAFERDRARWYDDRERPLSPEGKRKFRRAAAGLARWLPKVDLLLTSPLVRARQTAELLTVVARWPKATECDALAPGNAPTDVLAALRTYQATRIALVGHEPDLSELLSACIAGAARVTSEMKKGGIACVFFGAEPRAGHAVLRAVIPPRALRRMR